MTTPPRILAIAGSDSSGGAGIQADIKTVTMLGGYAMTAITAVTAQNSRGVQSIEELPPAMILGQFRSCVEDIGVDAIKVGMLRDSGVADFLGRYCSDRSIPLVVDPVMVATSGDVLVTGTDWDFFGSLFEAASVITPNIPELEFLAKWPVHGPESMCIAAKELAERYGSNVLAKGGHAESNNVVDCLASPSGEVKVFEHLRVDTPHTHGTGCTLSSAIATYLGMGVELEPAIEKAREFVRKALLAAPGFGAGHGPMGHQAVR